VFDAAEASSVALSFDEGDALSGKRSEVADAHDRYANIEVAAIRNTVATAAFLAADEGRPIGPDHVLAAVRREMQQLGGLFDASALQTTRSATAGTPRSQHTRRTPPARR
jgi:hypothetical protein